MFTGDYECSVDAKGRLTMPAKFREQLSKESFYINQGSEGQLNLYTQKEWAIIMDKMSQVKGNVKAVNQLKRMVIGTAQELELDSNGRVTLTSKLKTYANFNKKALVVGLGDKIEIWSVEKYNEVNNVDFAETMDIAGEYGIDF
ncbi:division/cell wall cluster transcriptional repressor MraZ [Pseudostreptobacillus hongkongensis]|uniref:division/cell wall cluster transcriptional repressor MraZ n=1 Tax=Pseudostreptobacillus hongkongensis TaxID=1162717 RepID=UPI0008316D98|nr:division/cell wall cluster transcriptional repressor MraZ [Pseudostreptobacillus hongkongensis]